MLLDLPLRASERCIRPIQPVPRCAPLGNRIVAALGRRVARRVGDTLLMTAGGPHVANRTRPTLEKRAKERARQEKRKQKDERRSSAKLTRSTEPRRQGEEDPDIAGIIPGPQPNPWGDDEEI